MTIDETFQGRIVEEDLAGRLPGIKLARMGSDQWSLLRSTAERRGWRRGDGWVWTGFGTHVRLSETLVHRGLLLHAEDSTKPRPHYVVTPSVQAIWDDIQRTREAQRAAARRENERDQAEKAHEAKSIRWATAQLVREHQGEYQEYLAMYNRANPLPE